MCVKVTWCSSLLSVVMAWVEFNAIVVTTSHLSVYIIMSFTSVRTIKENHIVLCCIIQCVFKLTR